MKTLTLPSGATAEIVEADDLSFGDREDILDLMDGDPEELQRSIGKTTNTTIRAVIRYAVKAWTVTDPKTGEPLALPAADPSVLRRMPLRDGAYLDHVLRPFLKELFPDFDVAPEGSPTQP